MFVLYGSCICSISGLKVSEGAVLDVHRSESMNKRHNDVLVHMQGCDITGCLIEEHRISVSL